MTEECVTRTIMNSLEQHGWTIVSFDYPQSGTGKMLHPDDSGSEKNKGGIIPDIVAVKDSMCLFFENKDKVVVNDFKKVAGLINNNRYMKDILSLLKNHTVETIYYGIGIPADKWNKKADIDKELVDFIYGVYEDGSDQFLYNPKSISL